MVTVSATALESHLSSAEASAPRVHVVLLNYRTPDLVIDSLRALQPQVAELGNARVTVVDGGSADGSAQAIAKALDQANWRPWCSFVPLADNRGFSAGNNAAIRPLLSPPESPDFFHLLNPDTVVRPGALNRLLAFMQARPDVGIAGSRLEDPDGSPQVSAFRFPTVASELVQGLRLGVLARWLPEHVVPMPIPAEHTRVDWVAGASMMIRREVFEDVGLLDEGYFLYFEEVDFCLRAAQAGWPTYYVPDSRVVHLVGRSTGISDERKARRRMPRYWFESRERYFKKNFGSVARRAADAACIAAYAARRARHRVAPIEDDAPPYFLRDFLRFALLPEVVPPRRPTGPASGDRLPLADRGMYNENPPDIGLLDLLKEDFATYDGNLLEQGYWALFVHRLGNARLSVRWLPARLPLSAAYVAANKLVEIATGIELPATVQVGRRVRIWHHGCIILHAARIGDDVTIRHLTTFGVRRDSDREAIPVIGDGVELGVGVSVLGAVRVGDGAKVAAHTLVLNDVPAGAVVGGTPARVLKRPPD